MAFALCIRRSASKFASVCGRVRSISAVVNRPSLSRNSSPLASRGSLYPTALDRLSSEQTLILVIDTESNSANQIDDRDLMMGKVNQERLAEYLGELKQKQDTNDRYVAALRGEQCTTSAKAK